MAITDFTRGLNPWAQKKVGRTVRVRQHGVSVFPDGRRLRFSTWTQLPVARVKTIASIKGAFMNHVAHLHRFTLPNGKIYDEFVQAETWSWPDGPVYFIALRDAKTGKPVPQSMWSADEVDHR